LAAVASMFVGATAGAILILSYGLAIPLALTGVIVLAATLAYAAHLKSNAVVQDVKG
jgi:hypothetical protein